jgi:hypothetical protein
MPISMYQAAVPGFARVLGSFATILEKAVVHCEARKIEPAVLVNARLFPDMFPLFRQVQIASDAAKGGASRLAGIEPPVFEDNEATFEELITRLRKTINYLETLREEQFADAEERTITWKTRTTSRSMQGAPYLFTHVTPNVYFHITTAYNILRHNGVEIGKHDFLGAN